MKKLLIFFLAILPFVGMRAESTVVGNTDNSSNWWTAFSQDYIIQKGEKWHFQFTNHNDEGDIFHNYVLAITTDANRNDNVNGYKEYLMMRADNHHWGDGGTVRQWTYTDTEGKSFIQEMNGATVDMTVLYDENNNFYVNSTITTSSGRTFMHNAQTTGADGSLCRLFFIVQKAHIEITTAEKVSRLPESRAGLGNSWTMIAGADDLKTKAQSGEYFFTIADAGRDVMVSWYNNTLSYRQSVNPVEHLTRLFYIETATVGDDGNAAAEGTEVYNLRNVEHSKYLMQTGNAGAEWQIAYNDQAITVSWTNLDIAFPHTNGVCTMAWHMYNNGNNYFGAWHELPEFNLSTMPLDGTESLAGNKSGSNIGTYVIYAIERNDFLKQYIGESTEKDLTKFIINPSFESKGWEDRGKWLGWSQIEGATSDMDYVENDADIEKEGTRYVQKYKTAGTFGVQQTINHLPKGVYKLQAATAYDGSSDIARLFAGSSEKNFNGLKQQSQVVTAIATNDNPLTIGAKITNVGDNRWFAVDNFRLTYLGNDYVGNAVTDKAYVQPGQTVTVSYNDKMSANNYAFGAGSETTVTIGGQNVTVTTTSDGFTFEVPALAAGQDHTLSIPAGVIGYSDASVYNEAQEITFHTPAIYDQECYLYNVGTQKLLSRGMGGGFNTAAKVDENGIKVSIETDANNKTTIKYTDTNWYAYNVGWCWTDGESAAGRAKMQYTVTGNNNDGYVFTTTNGVLYVYTVEGNDNLRVANDGTTQYAENCNLWKTTNLTATATAAKSYAGMASVSVQHPAMGSNVSFEATPNTDYVFVNWTDGEGNEVSTENPYQMTVNEDVTLTANFTNAPGYVNVGNDDNTSGWWTAFSPYYDLAPNSAKHISFTHHCADRGWPYLTFGTLLVTNAERGADGYKEYVVVRMDNNIGTKDVGNANWGTLNGNSISGTSAPNDGNSFLNFMNGAKVDMYIYRLGNEFFYKAEFTKNGTTHVKSYWTREMPADETLKFFLTGQNAWMEHLAVEDITMPVASEETPIAIGAENNSTFYKVNFHKPHVIADGEVYTYTFTNHAGAANWNNYILWFKDASSKEMVLRADKVEDTNTGGEFTYWDCDDSWNFHETLDNATVTVTAYNNDGVLGVNVTVQGGNGNNYTYAYKNTVTGDVTSVLSVSNSWLELTSEGAAAMPTTTLSDKSSEYAYGKIFETVSITRTLKAGWNTICLPFNTPVDAVAGADAMAYGFSAATAENELSFTEVDEMEANVPYLLYCGTEVVNPTLHNVTLMAAEPVEVENGDWKFISNYYPGMNMEGKYGVTNGQVRLAGSGSTLNGMRAYFNFEGSGDAQAKIKVDGIDGDDDETAISTITGNETAVTYYSLDGKRLAAPVKGINIVKFNDNTIRKIIVK